MLTEWMFMETSSVKRLFKNTYFRRNVLRITLLPLFIMIENHITYRWYSEGKRKHKVFSKRKHFQLPKYKCKSIASYIFQDKNLEICCQVLMSLCYPQQSVAKSVVVSLCYIECLNNFFPALGKINPICCFSFFLPHGPPANAL